MDLWLVSEDGELHQLCREVLREFDGRDWRLSTGVATSFISEKDFYIWDFETDADLTQAFDQNLANHLFLINRNHVAKFHDRLGRKGANVILKPVTQATLASFLRLIVSAHEERISNRIVSRPDRDKIMECLVRTNYWLQEVDHERTNFLSRILHDFRAPLTAILGYCGLLHAEALGPLNEDQKEVVRRMHHSTKRLSSMSSTIFQLNVGRDDKRPANLDTGAVRECIEQALHEVRPLTDQKKIAVSVNLDAVPPWLQFDSGLMEQVLINLLENACKFTPNAGRIRIRSGPFFWDRRSLQVATATAPERRRDCCRGVNAYRVDIFNSGTPIPSDQLENLFEGDTTRSGGPCRSGGGLGLVICRRAVEQHEGRIWVQNTESGPVFSIILPIQLGLGKTKRKRSNPGISEVH